MTAPLLEVKHLKTYFYTYEGTVRALEDVSLHINKGEIFGLVGETGCGKSVTARSAMRLIEAPGKIVGGEILFKGRDLLSLSEDELQKIRGNQISMVFQDPMASLNPLMKIGNQVAEVLKIHKKVESGEKLRKRVVEILRMVRLPSPERIVENYPFELSGGMRQRVMIAMMVSTNPELLIADEPTTALDVSIQAQILSIIKSMKEKMSVSVWIITHDLGVIAETCDRLCVMYAGAVVECGSVHELFQNPLHPYTQGLLKAIPKAHEKADRLDTIPGSVPNLISPPSGCRFHPRCARAGRECSERGPEKVKITDTHFVSCGHYTQGNQEQ
jgi:peptide/nickel transport system ATP-binding protein